MSSCRNPLSHLLVLVLLLLAATGAFAQSASPGGGLLPVTRAFALKPAIDKPGTIALHFDIAPHYYLYRGRIHAKILTPGVTAGALETPAGTKEHDPYLGDVEIYHDSLDARQPYTTQGAGPAAVQVAVTYQGCHEVTPKICYPPNTQTFTLPVHRQAVASTSQPRVEVWHSGAAKAPSSQPGIIPWIPEGGIHRSRATPGELLSVPTLGKAGEPLPPDQAFVVDAIARSPTELLLRWTMPRGYYIYRDHTALSLEDSAGATLGAPRWPPGVLHADPYFGENVVYFDEVDLPVPLLRNTAGTVRQVTLRVTFQGCQNGGICYPPLVRAIKVDVPAASASQLTALAKAATSGAPVIAPPVSTSAVPRAVVAPPAAVTDAPAQPAASPLATGLAFALLLAFVGGLILNLMPCVLPVLAIKAVGVLESGESRQRAQSHALAYAAGVICTFLAIGLVILGLRGAGRAIGWGTQLQQPVIVGVLACVLFVVGLSMSGVVQFGSRLGNVGASLTRRGGLAGHFFTGVLAVIVASPCTAPFMGAALAYAFVAPAAHELLVMLALGVGLALPLTLIGLVPALARLLPKPGRWMETLKQILAFPMYLSTVWLVWVLAHQRGADAVALVLVAMVLLGAAAWWHGRAHPGRRLGHAFTLVLTVAAIVALAGVARIAPPVRTAAMDGDAVAFSPAKLQALREAGMPVFVDIGADWCVTCKANEYTVLDTQAFRKLLQQTGAVYMKGDWTDVDPVIGAYLKQFHSPGVPLYVVYPRGGGVGRALPTVLTASLVRNALETAAR